MPSQHSADTTPVHVRVPRELKAAVAAELERRGETMSSLVERALREYLTPPHPDQR